MLQPGVTLTLILLLIFLLYVLGSVSINEEVDGKYIYVYTVVDLYCRDNIATLVMTRLETKVAGDISHCPIFFKSYLHSHNPASPLHKRRTANLRKSCLCNLLKLIQHKQLCILKWFFSTALLLNVIRQNK